MPQLLQISGTSYAADDPALAAVLEHAHAHGVRPRCLCVAAGVEMYVARHQERFLVKRMPGTARLHHPACPSYEPDPEASGLGELMDDAVREATPDCYELRVDFPWQRFAGRASRTVTGAEAGEVKASGKRLSLRGLTHFLFERAGFNRWTPAMQDRRSYAVVQRHLLAVARQMTLKGVVLDQRLYVPEPFSEGTFADSVQRRKSKLAFLHSHEDATPLGLLIGEFKSSEAVTFGTKVWIKHMPDQPLLISTHTWSRITRKYADLLETREMDPHSRSRLIATALIRCKRENVYEIDAMSLMMTSEHWIPVEYGYELSLIGALVAAQRRFIKPLRYESLHPEVFANAMLLDAGSESAPLHVISPFTRTAGKRLKAEAVAQAGEAVWVWHTEAALPAFPVVP